ncbi:MAG: LPS assembly lipoprotein LptE [Phycisphaerae bacterium]
MSKYWRLARGIHGIAGLLVLASLTTLPAGCGYTMNSIYPAGIHTVAVPIWKNRTFRRGLEFRLTEAIDKNIESRTPYRLAPLNQADTELTGTIEQVQEGVLSNSFQTNLPQETQITLVVNFTWRDLHSGKVLSRRVHFATSSTEIPQVGQQLADAEQIAVERMARAVVNQMQKSW